MAVEQEERTGVEESLEVAALKRQTVLTARESIFFPSSSHLFPRFFPGSDVTLEAMEEHLI